MEMVENEIKIQSKKDKVLYDYQQQSLDKIFDRIKQQGNRVISNLDPTINGAMVSRIGRDLYFGTDRYDQDQTELQQRIRACPEPVVLPQAGHFVQEHGHDIAVQALQTFFNSDSAGDRQ
jgi:hypothetical protein